MIYFASIIAYLILLGCIGVYKSRSVKNEEDFAVAGRSLSPWIMVCTMLAVWIGTGSIVGNAEKTYQVGVSALILPIGTFIGMILLAMIASRARSIEASTVPEIIGGRFGQTARSLSVVSLIIAYMVIVSYQFNAGGAVLEVITGDKDPVMLKAGDQLTDFQLRKGRVIYNPKEGWTGQDQISFVPKQSAADATVVDYRIGVIDAENVIKAAEDLLEVDNSVAIKPGNYARIKVKPETLKGDTYTISSMPANGKLELVEPKLTAIKATIIAAVFITVYTMLAGLMSLAYADIVTGSLITVVMIAACIIYWFECGGWAGISAAYTAMGDRPDHLNFFSPAIFKPVKIINYCLPVFLLVLGDANQYQRIFASKSAKGAKSAVTVMIFAALIIELLIIFCAFMIASKVPDPENGKYILIYAAKHFMPIPLGCLFMVTVIGIITSTANSFLLVPSTTFIHDVYLNYINPKASSKKVLFLSRAMVLVFGIIAYFVSRAFAESTGFFEKALIAFTIYGASVTPSVVAAIVWKGATRAGSVTSILVGVVVALFWSSLPFVQNSEFLRDLDAVLPAIILSVLCLIVVSLLTKNLEALNETKQSETPSEQA
ncbi:MAG: sodium:solute symporter family protein [Phycisphaerae bacterium]|nr:sodium:solute symporter family protein [Phycisphaerae bacterium]